MKGKVQVSNGQHYVQLDDGTTTCKRTRKTISNRKNFTQVHHFKWDYSVLIDYNKSVNHQLVNLGDTSIN